MSEAHPLPDRSSTKGEAVADMAGRIGHKPVLYRNAKTVLTIESEGFKEKLLCDGPVLNLGDACAYGCEYCYVETDMRKLVVPLIKRYLAEQSGTSAARLNFEDVIARRRKDAHNGSIAVLQDQIAQGLAGARTKKVLYTSSTVDPAPNIELLLETAEACTLLFDSTAWDIRILSKSPLIAKLVRDGLVPEKYHQRLIFGFSAGTLNDGLAAAIETGTPLVSKRIEALHWLQDHGYRTFGMICPSLPQEDYEGFSREICNAVRVDRCENVWAEVINVRGRSFTRTRDALIENGYLEDAHRVESITGQENHQAWETYARQTFEAHARHIPPSKLRFLQYTKKETNQWWADRTSNGAVLLGKISRMPTTKAPAPDTQQSKTYKELYKEFLPAAIKLYGLGDEAHASASNSASEVLDGLNPEQRRNLQALEEVVRTGLAASVMAAKALQQIYAHNGGVYWKRSYPSFELYCREKWGYGKAQTYRLTAAGEFLIALESDQSPNGDSNNGWWYPQSESHIRPILKLSRGDQVKCWNRIIQRHHPANLTAEIVSAEIRAAAKEFELTFKSKRPRKKTRRRDLSTKLLDKLEAQISGEHNETEIRRLIASIRDLL